MKDSSNSSFLFSLTATLDFEIKQYDLILQMLHANINILFTTNLPNLNPILDQQATCQQGWILFTSSRLSSLATCIWPSPYKKSFQHGLISLCQSLSLYILQFWTPTHSSQASLPFVNVAPCEESHSTGNTKLTLRFSANSRYPSLYLQCSNYNIALVTVICMSIRTLGTDTSSPNPQGLILHHHRLLSLAHYVIHSGEAFPDHFYALTHSSYQLLPHCISFSSLLKFKLLGSGYLVCLVQC